MSKDERPKAWREEIKRRDVAYERHQKEANVLFAKAIEERKGNYEAYCDLIGQSKELREKERDDG